MDATIDDVHGSAPATGADSSNMHELCAVSSLDAPSAKEAGLNPCARAFIPSENPKDTTLPAMTPEEEPFLAAQLKGLLLEPRREIYHHVLKLDRRVVLVKEQELAFFENHRRLCAMHRHGNVKDNQLTCTDVFGNKQTVEAKAPRSVTDLLLTCKQIRYEAERFFWAGNHFYFRDFDHLEKVAKSCSYGTCEMQHITLSFQSLPYWTVPHTG